MAHFVISGINGQSNAQALAQSLEMAVRNGTLDQQFKASGEMLTFAVGLLSTSMRMEVSVPLHLFNAFD